MPDFSWLQKMLVFSIIEIATGLALFIWGDVHGHSVTKAKYNKEIAKIKQEEADAQEAQKAKDNQIQALANQIGVTAQAAADNQAEADSENKYAIKLENEIKARPLPIDCKPSAGRVQWINNAGKN